MKKKMLFFTVFLLLAFICVNVVSAANTTPNSSNAKLTSSSKFIQVHVVYLNKQGKSIKNAKVGDTVTCAIFVTNTGKKVYNVKVKDIPSPSVKAKILYANISKGTFKKDTWNIGSVKYHETPMIIMVAKLLSSGTDTTHLSLYVQGKSINQAIATLKVKK